MRIDNIKHLFPQVPEQDKKEIEIKKLDLSKEKAIVFK